MQKKLINWSSPIFNAQMRFGVLILYLCTAFMSHAQTTTLYTANFNSNATGWNLSTAGGGNAWKWFSDQGVGASGGLRTKDVQTSVQNWAIAPSISLSTGVNYRLKLKSYCATANTRTLSFAFNSSASRTGSTTISTTGNVATSFTEYKSDIFTVSSTGTYFPMFWANQNAGSGVYIFLYADDFIVESVQNIEPSVSISAPSASAILVAGSSTTLTANSSDPDGTISSVAFYSNGTLLGSDNSSPFTFDMTVPLGNNTVYAIATDNGGVSTTSSTVSYVGNQAPGISITTPANNSTYSRTSNFTINTSVSDANGTVSKVEFFLNGTKLGEDVTNPFGYGFSNVGTPLGANTITTVATDNHGASTTSSPITVNITNRTPSVSITSPTASSSHPAGLLTISSNASDVDGTVSQVEFLVNNVVVGSDATAPFSFDWTSTAAGNYTLRARATDNDGATSLSANVTITVVANTCALTLPTATSTTVCEGNTVSFTSTSSGGTVQWQHQAVGGSFANISGATSATYVASLAGNYRAVWTYSNGATCETGSKSLVVNPLPVVTTNTIIFNGYEPASGVVSASGGTSPYTYNWLNIDTCLNANCDSAFVSNNGQPISVTVIDYLGCANLKTFAVINSSGVSDGGQFTDLLKSRIPTYATKVPAIEEKFQAFIEDDKLNTETNQNKSLFPNKIITIPIVFGAISNPSSSSVGPPIGAGQTNVGTKNNEIKNYLTPSRINEQLGVLNSAFSSKSISYKGENYTIQFCLATKNDLNENVSNGTVMVEDANLSYFKDRLYYPTLNTTTNTWEFLNWSVEPQTCFDGWTAPTPGPNSNSIFNYCGWFDRMDILNKFSRKKYLRIIVCDFFGANGYGTTPSTNIAPSNDEILLQKYDGIFLNFNAFFGRNQYSAGKDLVHEVGHWLNLRHTFDNLCDAYTAEINNQNFTPDAGALWDFVKDTPPQRTAANGFNTGSICCSALVVPSCTTTIVPTSVYSNFPYDDKNHMDYGVGINRIRFSDGQLERMFYSLAYFRNELFTISNLQHTGVACADPLAAFEVSTDFVCGSGSNAELEITRFQNPTGTTYNWTSSEPSGVSFSGSNTDAVRTVSFNTASIAGNEVTVTLKCTLGLKTAQYSKIIYVTKNCTPCVDPQKQNLFFGNSAGLSFPSNSVKASPAFGSFTSLPAVDRIQNSGGVVSISGDDGKLLFYAAGNKIWNKRHDVLSPTIFSDENSSQFGVATKAPDYSETNQTYLMFTVPALGGANYNKGLRMHKIRVSSTTGINDVPTPVVNTSDYNIALAAPSGAPAGDDGAALVSEKITLIPKANKKDFYVIVQGPSGDATYGEKFYVYEVTGSSAPAFVESYDAKFIAEKGVLKTSTDGSKLLSTYTRSFDPLTGFAANGDNSWVFNFDKSTGAITANRELVLGTATTASAFGGSFAYEGSAVYLNVNKQTLGGTTPVKYSGIYKFDLTATGTGPITGSLVERIQPGTSNSVDLSLSSNRSILISNPAQQGFYEECCPTSSNPSFGNTNLGVLYFPDNYSTPGFTWEGPKLATNSSTQNIRSRTGLPNFSDAVKPLVAGNLQTEAFDFGEGLIETCAGAVVKTINIDCIENANTNNTLKDLYAEFTLTEFCNHYPNVYVSTKDCGFPVTTTFQYLDNFNVWQNITSQAYVASENNGSTLVFDQIASGIPNVTKSKVENLDNVTAAYSPRDCSDQNWTNPIETVKFRIHVEAQSTTAVGDFKLAIHVSDGDLSSPACDGSAIIAYCEGRSQLTCVRKAVAEREEINSNVPQPKTWDVLLFPNPASSKIGFQMIAAEKNEAATIEVRDALGRLAKSKSVTSSNFELDCPELANGLYSVRVSQKGNSKTQTLVIRK